MTTTFSTHYLEVADMFFSVAVILYVTLGLAMLNIIKKYNLKHELEKFENLIYFTIAIMLTSLSFLICHLVWVICIEKSVFASNISGVIIGVICGIVIIRFVEKRVCK